MFNKVILIGRLVADPELKTTPNGTTVTSFSIAVNRPYVSKDGERNTDFIDVVAFKHAAKFICQYFAKGAKILIDGSIQTRSYTDKNGNKRKVWEVIANNAHFVDSKSSSQTETHAGAQMPSAAAEGFTIIDGDDDLPF